MNTPWSQQLEETNYVFFMYLQPNKYPNIDAAPEKKNVLFCQAELK